MTKIREHTMSMQTLKSIEKNFNNLSLRLKIEFFLFPLIIIIAYMILHENNASKIEIKPLVINEKMLDKKMNENILDIIESIEKYINKEKIKVVNVSNKEKQIEIKINTNTKKQLQFINFLENYNNFSSINNLEIANDTLQVTLNFSKYFFKTASTFKNNFKFFEKKEAKEKLNLLAIIDNEAFINNKWLKKGDKIGEYQVIKIKKQKVLVKKSKEIFSIGIFKNENL